MTTVKGEVKVVQHYVGLPVKRGACCRDDILALYMPQSERELYWREP